MAVTPESLCFELDCCPLGVTVPIIIVTQPLLVEAANEVTPEYTAQDSLTELQTEAFTTLLT
jgi:hypothetical protein